MSIKALSWAFQQEIYSSAQKFVLVALANFTSETGKSYPSVQTICRITMQNEKTVRKALADLVAQGIIKDTGKKFGPTQQVKVWELPDEAKEYIDTQKRVASKDSSKTPARLQQDSSKIPIFGEQSLNPEPLAQNQETKDKSSLNAAKRKAAEEKAADFEKFWEAYPRKDAKKAAQAAFAKVKTPVATLIACVMLHRQRKSWKESREFIPLPATWLNGERWLDEQITLGEAGTKQELEHRLATVHDAAWAEMDFTKRKVMFAEISKLEQQIKSLG